MRAADIMTTPVVTVPVEATVKEAAATLLEHGISGAPVVDAEGRLVGMVTEADLIGLEATPDPRTTLLRRGHAPTEVPRTVSQVMTRDPIAVAGPADMADVCDALLRHGFRAIPIVDGDRVIGIVARRDILRVLARSDAEIAGDLRDRLGGDPETYGEWDVTVRDGVATLRGPRQKAAQTFAELLARTVPGLVGVKFAESAPTHR